MIAFTQEEKFWSKVGKEGPDNCWFWLSSCDSKGYGKVRFYKRNRLSHRVAWEIVRGSINDRWLFVCHSCDNRLCCNPNHLFLGTAKDNAMDMARKGRVGRSNMPGWMNGNARLNPEDVAEMKRLRSDGHTLASIGKRFGVTSSHVGNIYHGRKWRTTENA